jgi:hypothetical protein
MGRTNRFAIGACALLLAAGCVDNQPGVTGVQSLKVALVNPASPGTPAMRLPDTTRMITLDVSAFDADGSQNTTLTTQLQVYVQYLGTLTPALEAPAPLATFNLVNGVAKGQVVTLPPVFGPTTLWVQDGAGSAPTYATGSSPQLWFRDPQIVDIQRCAVMFPTCETSLDALASSPLVSKNVDVRTSRYGADGRLVVTSVFAQGYTVSDVKCAAGGGPPCVAETYNGVEVFSFSAPKDQNGDSIVEGQVITGFAGGVSLFNGLIEIGFPQTFTPDTRDVNPAREPAPQKLDQATWFGPLSSPDGIINFKRWQATPIEIDNAKVCPLDADYTTYKQWKIDPTPGGTCAKGAVINVITAGVLPFDPATKVGQTLPKVVGVLRPVSAGSFNVWIIYPRSAADLGM